MLISALGVVGHYARWSLIVGLIAGLTLPGLALIIKDWLAHLIFALLLVSAYRIGPAATLGARSDAVQSARRVLVYQLGAPVLALLLLFATGSANNIFGIALVLALAAPSISGAPNFAIMLGRDPTRAMRLLLIGTALFPLTVVPVFILLPAIPTLSEVVESAAKLITVIAIAVGAGFILRRNQTLSSNECNALDGAAALLLGVMVVGLMSAMGPALRETPGQLAIWLAFAFVLNFGSQVLAYTMDADRDAGAAIVAGNRNIALFLVALPADLTDSLLLFIGCYQIPMYLTPTLMRYLYGSDRQPRQ